MELHSVPKEMLIVTDHLRSLMCWYVSCGGAAGPTFQLALGDKVPRSVPLKNMMHSETYRHFEGSANLLVWCTWRLDDATAPITSSDDETSSIERGLAKLAGAAVYEATVVPPAWDLTVQFSNGYRLSVFCDHLPGQPSFDGNWELVSRSHALYVGPGSKYSVHERVEKKE